MTEVMQGIRILEVAEHTFVPAASAVLAEWGADVIKIEHVERGDAMRGLASSGVVSLGSGAHVLLEHSNRGKRSLGLDLASTDGLDVLHRLIATSDVFLTNKMPEVRKKLAIDMEQVRAHNPQIVYASGTGQGTEGPDAASGSYDSLAYWSRAGVAVSLTEPGATEVPKPPPAFGDSIGAMTIAGGIMGALLHRERTGEATTVDVSLLGVGMWSLGPAVALSLQHGVPWHAPRADSPNFNPLVGNFATKDGKLVALTCLQAAEYWPDACRVIGRPELADDPRFVGAKALRENSDAAVEVLAEAFAERTAAEWQEQLQDFRGQWCMVQSTLEAVQDRQALANGYVQDYETSDGTAFQLVAPPVRYGGAAATPRRAPDFNEHGDSILEELGLDWDAIVDLKVRGVVA